MTSTTSADGLRDVLARACEQTGIQPHSAQVIRIAENALFRIGNGTVARITRPGQLAAARRELRMARWLAHSGVPAVRPVPGHTAPVVVGQRAVTFWEELPDHRHGTPLEVARLLKQLHHAPRPGVALDELDPFGKIRTRLAAAHALDPEDRDWLCGYTEETAEAWGNLHFDQRCVLHGDAWTGNIATPTAGGIPRLLDLDGASIGPPEWDLTSTAVKVTSTGSVTSAEYAAFCEEYERDVTTWHGWEVLRNTRELRMVTYAARIATEHPGHRRALGEARYRAECLRGLNGPRPWTWTAVP